MAITISFALTPAARLNLLKWHTKTCDDTLTFARAIGCYAAANAVGSQDTGGTESTVIVGLLALANTSGQLQIRCGTEEIFLNQNERYKKY